MNQNNPQSEKLPDGQQKLETHMDYTKTPLENGPISNMNSQQVIQFSSLYHHQCKTLCYRTFIDILLTKDYKLLIIGGEPPEVELLAAWKFIIDEYCSLIHTEKSDTIFEVYKKIIMCQWKLTFVENACAFLKVFWDEEIANALVDAGFDYINSLEDREQYLRQIYMVESEAKTLIVLLNQYTAEYKQLCPEDEAEVDRDEMDYQKELAYLSKFMGKRINPSKITVIEFCAIVNIYLDARRAIV